MGPTVTKKQSLNLQYWVSLPDPPNSPFQNINIYRSRLLLNTITHQHIEEYNLHFSSIEEYHKYRKEEEWRHQSSNPPPWIYGIKHFRQTSSTDFCINFYSGSVYFQKVEVRLKEVNDIPYEDYLYLLKGSLSGFSFLHRKYGNFHIREEMIFINREGKVKVWINSNLSVCVPHSRQMQMSQMIVQIISLIEENVDNEYMADSLFSHYLKRKKRFDNCSFEYVEEEFREFCARLKVKIPGHMKSVSDLFNEQKSESNFDFDQKKSDYSKKSLPQYSRFHKSEQIKQQLTLKQTNSSHNPAQVSKFGTPQNSRQNNSRNFPLSNNKPFTPNIIKKPQPLNEYFPDKTDKMRTRKLSPFNQQPFTRVNSPSQNMQIEFRSPPSTPRINFVHQSPNTVGKYEDRRKMQGVKLNSNAGKVYFPVTKQKKLVVNRRREVKNQKYYSCENTYELDAEIAADLELFLGTKM